MAPVDRWILGAALAVRVRRTSCCARSTSHRGRDRRCEAPDASPVLLRCRRCCARVSTGRPGARRRLTKRRRTPAKCNLIILGKAAKLYWNAAPSARPVRPAMSITQGRLRAHGRTDGHSARSGVRPQAACPPEMLGTELVCRRWAAGPLRCGHAGVSCVVCRLAGCSPLAAVWSPRARPAADARASCTLAVPLRGPVGKTGCLELAEHGTRTCASNVQQDRVQAHRAPSR